MQILNTGRVLRRKVRSLAFAVAAVAAVAAISVPAAYANETVWSCGITDASGTASIWVAAAGKGLESRNECSSGAGLAAEAPGKHVTKGETAQWETTAPSGLKIVLAYVPPNAMRSSALNDGNSFYGGGFFWDGGSRNVNDSNNVKGFGAAGLWTSHFGFRIVCDRQPCPAGQGFGQAALAVVDIGLQVAETQKPTLSGAGVWSSSGWIRGAWPLVVTGDSPSGVCALASYLDGKLVAAKSSVRVNTTWHQCNETGLSGLAATVNTASYADGPGSMALYGADAAQLGVSAGKTLLIDNTQPTVSISGPTDAPSTAGTQELSVVGRAGPSGVSGVGCSVDGSPVLWSGPATTVPVAGIGAHQVTCYATNSARDSAGQVAISAPSMWSMSIREPSVATVSFSRVVDALRCAWAPERVRIPSHWVTGRAHGRRVRVKLPAQIRTVRVVHCRPRVIVKRVRIRGRYREERVIVLPHNVRRSKRYVRYGAVTSVSGWLGTADGNAVGGQPVEVLTAPTSSPGQLKPASTAVTAANGSWTTELPPGPSRVVRVSFRGSGTVEPALSNTARVLVPAPVKLTINPRATHWGATIRLAGRLIGGHIPPAGELVVLRVGWAGGSAEIGHVYADRRGVFKSAYTFLRGNGSETYRIWAQTVRETDYPYAVGTSRKVSVGVS